MMQNKDKKYIKKFMILLFWLGVWQITAVCVDNFLLVVTPLQALRAIIVLAGQVEFWRSALGSLWRIAAGFLLGAVLGLLLAAVSYRYRLAEEILRPFMVFCKAVPVAVFAVLLLIWWSIHDHTDDTHLLLMIRYPHSSDNIFSVFMQKSVDPACCLLFLHDNAYQRHSCVSRILSHNPSPF